MQPDTKEYLAGRGYVTDDKVARNRIVEELRALVPTIDSVDDVDRNAALVIQLRTDVLGASDNEDIDKELNYLVGDLLSVAPEGRMQKALENGYVLCTVRVKRALEEGEEPVSKSARFISSDPAVVERYSSQPALDRAVKAGKRATDVVEMGGRRIPALATRKLGLFRRTHEQIALAMPVDES